METIKNISTGKNNQSEPDITGLLSDNQLENFGLIKLAAIKIRADITAMNDLIRGSGAPIRLVPTDPLSLVENDISIAARKHEQAENRIKASAFAAANREAA